MVVKAAEGRDRLRAGDLVGRLAGFARVVENGQGDRLPLIVRKRDGGYGYAATDLATVRYWTAERGATDLLARCPGFALVVLDAGETPPRVSLGAAFRLRQAARRAGVAVLLVGRRRVAGAGATLALRTRRDALAWAGSRRAPTRLAGMSTRVHVLRNQGAIWDPSLLAATSNERWWWSP